MPDLDGSVALVTGARRGIGRAIALELARDGADVAINDVEGEEEAERVAAEVRALGRRSIVVLADVSEPAQVEAMIERVVRELGGIHILVNNAGIEPITPFLEISADEWEQVTQTNLKGEFLCAQSAARRMIEAKTGGAILNIGSVQAGMAMPGRSHYAPAKRAVEALTANLALELAPHGIRVNCINPGLIKTEMTAWVMNDPETLPRVLDRIALKRAGDPEEIAAVAAFLVSDKASYITGQSIYVDGGFRIL